jgi:glycosidase
MNRFASVVGEDPRKERLGAALNLFLKGTPLIYYGQELGMRGTPRPEYKSDEKDIGDREAFEWSAKTQAPGQANWYKGRKTYWTQRFAKDDDGVSVAEEDRNPASLLNHYRKLLELRRSNPALQDGDQRVLDSQRNILAVQRASGRERVLIVANLSDRPADYSARGRNLISGKNIAGKLHLQAYEAAVLRL